MQLKFTIFLPFFQFQRMDSEEIDDYPEMEPKNQSIFGNSNLASLLDKSSKLSHRHLDDSKPMVLSSVSSSSSSSSSSSVSSPSAQQQHLMKEQLKDQQQMHRQQQNAAAAAAALTAAQSNGTSEYISKLRFESMNRCFN